MKAVVFAAIVGGVVAAGSASAQTPPVPEPPTQAQIQARHAIAALEGVLENAARYGAQMLDQRLQASSAANMVMFAGMARARGFRLDGYGVVFSVEFPSLRRSMVWSMRALERGRASAASTAEPARPAANEPFIDPRQIYLTEISNAFVDAIVDHGAPVGVGPEEWLTVAARETVDRRFVPGDPKDTVLTVVLRIKGSDLSALRDRSLTREEARTRVEIKQY